MDYPTSHANKCFNVKSNFNQIIYEVKITFENNIKKDTLFLHRILLRCLGIGTGFDIVCDHYEYSNLLPFPERFVSGDCLYQFIELNFILHFVKENKEKTYVMVSMKSFRTHVNLR